MSPRRLLPLVFAAAALVLAPAVAPAQIGWNVTYQDGDIRSGGTGFADPGVDPGETLSRGQLRRNSVTEALNYLGRHLDGRGSANLNFLPSGSSGAVAFFGPDGIANLPGSFQNGQVYQRARSGVTPPYDPPVPFDGQGAFNFGFGWNYHGQVNSPNPGNLDMVTVAIHELLHGAGFASYTNPRGTNQNQFINGEGLGERPVGTPDIYSELDRHLQRGNTAGAGSLFNTNIASPNYASFVGDPSTFLNGNNATTGLFFGGEYAREVFGGPVPMYAPNPYQPGSSTSHDNTFPEGVMHFGTGPATVRRMLAYEIAMMLDIGWNVYTWNGTTGNWLDGATSVANSRWRTNQGIVVDDQVNFFNLFSNPGLAPVLPVYGQVTSNIVLNFGGASAFTATNDIGTVRLARLNLSNTDPSGLGVITGGTLLFGQNSDGTASVLAPKIVQKAGGFTINSAILIPNGLTVDGPGTGQVTIGGTVGGNGGLTKAGGFILALTGNNTYAGPTTVNAGTLLVSNQTGNNSGTGTGAVTVNAGAMLGGNGRIGDGTAGSLLVQSGGIVRPGNGLTVSTLTVNSNLDAAFAGGSVLRVTVGSVAVGGSKLATAGAADIDLTGVTTGNKLNVELDDLSGLQFGQAYTITILDATGSSGSVLYNGGTFDANFFNVTADFALSGMVVTGNSEVVQISFTPVPEPAWVLVVAALGLVARRRVTSSSSASA